jgi:hypothetical protein
LQGIKSWTYIYKPSYSFGMFLWIAYRQRYRNH